MILVPAMSWRRTTYPYVKSAQLYSCPSNSTPYEQDGYADDSSNPKMAVLPAGSPRFKSSYAINGTDYGIAGTAPTEYGRSSSLSAIGDTAQTVLVGESIYRFLRIWLQLQRCHLHPGSSRFQATCRPATSSSAMATLRRSSPRRLVIRSICGTLKKSTIRPAWPLIAATMRV